MENEEYFKSHHWKNVEENWLDPKFRRFCSIERAVKIQKLREICQHPISFKLNNEIICAECGQTIS